MQILLAGALPLVFLASGASRTLAQQTPPDGPSPVRATFAIIDTSGGRIGQVTARQIPDSVLLQVLVHGLAPGRHGLHLHAQAVCQPPAFTTAGGHFNPDGKQHGSRNPAGAHLGDLPNLVVDPRGEGRAQLSIPGVTLSAGPRSIGIPGAALVIHSNPDDEVTDPTGNAGARIACAVISIAPS